MRDRHTYNKNDSDLLKKIYQQVEEKLQFDRKKFKQQITFKFIIYCSTSIFLYLSLYKIETPHYYIFCFILYGFSSLLFAFNFSHDFSHNTIFKSKKANNYCFIAIYTLVGAHAQAWKRRHVDSHHYAPNVSDYDSDLNITKLIRVIPKSDYAWYHTIQHIYAPFIYTTYSLFWIFIKDFVLLFSDDKYNKDKNSTYYLSFILQKVTYCSLLIILPLLYSPQDWQIILIGFILMHVTQSLFLLFTFFMTHHVEKTAYPTTNEKGFINCSWFMNQIKSSNDMYPFSPTANFIFGGFNNHIAHHLFPHYHHIYYPELNKILYEILQKNGITPNQTSYWGGIVSHIKLLKIRSTLD